MRFRDNERAQSVQIGAVLLFAVLVLSFTTYQAAVVPDQNREVEFDHSQRVQGQFQELRNAVVSMAGGGGQRSTAVQLGTRYPSRAVAMNPPPPAGTLRTAGTADPRVNVSISNAVADGETGDVWNGTARNYTTGAVVYEPGYNVYRTAPSTVYEQTVLYNSFDGRDLSLTSQTFVDGDELSLIALNGSLTRTSSGAASVDARPVSAGERTIRVTGTASEPITVTVPTRLANETWTELLRPEYDDEGGRIDRQFYEDVPGESYDRLHLRLVPGDYRLRLTKVGVGTGVTDEPATYLTDATDGSTTVRRGETVDVTVEARDDYNNPVRDVTVNASAEAGSVSPATGTTGEDGRATVTYDAGGVDPGTYDMNVSLSAIDGSFDGETGENVTVPVRVTASSGGPGDGAYEVDWRSPEGDDSNGGAALSDCSAESCVWDVGASDGDSLTLNATLSPRYDGVGVDFAVDNSTIADVNPGAGETDADGSRTTELTANANGTVEVLASANEDGDVITVEVTNVSGGSSSAPTVQNGIRYDGGLATTGSDSAIRFDVTNVDSQFARVQGVAVTARNGVDSEIFDGDAREIEIGGGDSTGYRDESGNPSASALAADGSSIALDQNAVLSDSGDGASATAFVGQFGTASGNSFSQYDFAGLERVSSTDDWDVSVTLEFRDRGDVTYYFREP